MDDADIIEYNEKDSGFIGTTVNGNKIFCIAIKVKNGKSLSNSQINYYASLISKERAEAGFQDHAMFQHHMILDGARDALQQSALLPKLMTLLNSHNIKTGILILKKKQQNLLFIS